MFAVLVLTALLATCSCRGPATGRVPVILVTIDTLRLDRVGLHGAKLPTPAIDRIGREGAVADYAVAPFGRTTQSIGSIFTGLHPLHHGADGLGMSLPAEAVTLAEILAQRGYETAAFATNVVLAPELAFNQGFRLYSNPRARWEHDCADAITEDALTYVARREFGDKPLFLWLHYLDPHWPYEPRPEYARAAGAPGGDATRIAERVASSQLAWGRLIFDARAALAPAEIETLRRLYDGEVVQTDAALGRLWDGLAKDGLLDDAIVILTSDHGESLGEHDYWFAHGEYIYDSVLRVPLFVRAPGVRAGTRLSGIVRLEDVMPTILDLAGLTVPDGLDGRSLAAELRRGGAVAVPARSAVHLADHLLVRNENPRRPVKGREGRWWALREGNLKLIRIPTGTGTWSEELYDIASDPGEQHNVVAERAADAARLRGELERAAAALARGGRPETAEQPAVDRDALRSLGYAQ